jgi:hypothetical protein
VAHNTALKAKAMNNRRRAKEREVAERSKPRSPTGNGRQLQALLDHELRALPDKYRAAIVLCDLEGKSIKEAARQLGCPPGTIGTRLSRGRRLLARRLARHGLRLSGGVIATMLSQNGASASVPLPLVASTVKAATLFAAGQAASGTISAKVAALTEGVLKTMLLTKIKIATVLLLAVGAVASLSVVLHAQDGPTKYVNAADARSTNSRTDPPPRPQTAADDPEAKWDETPRIREIQPYILVPKWESDGVTVRSLGCVLKELKATDEQCKELMKVDHEIRDKFEQGAERDREMTKAISDAAPRVLKPEQIKRFKQMSLQMLGGPLGGPFPGVGAFTYPEIQQRLKFSDKQQEQIKAIDDVAKKEYEDEQNKVFAAGGAWTLVDHFDHARRIHKAALEKALRLLTEDQGKAWKKMIGEPFEYTRDEELEDAGKNE